MNIIRKIFPPSQPVKMVLVVRSDVQMGCGKVAAQCSHAAIALHKLSIEKDNPHLKAWFKNGQPKIVLKTNLESNLRNIFEQCKRSNMTACLIFDAGKTELEASTLTVLGIGPDYNDVIDKLTGDFKLY